jgi:hypothetical protein
MTRSKHDYQYIGRQTLYWGSYRPKTMHSVRRVAEHCNHGVTRVLKLKC